MQIETTHLYDTKNEDKYRWFEWHDDNCNAAKSNKNISSLIKCDCKVFYKRFNINDFVQYDQ